MGEQVISRLRTPLDLPIFLFLVSALVGVWASYDPATSWRKFAMIVAAVALYYSLVALRDKPQVLETIVWLFLFGCCALTLYFVTQHDYAAQPGKFGFITAIGLSLNRITPQFRMHVFDPNITAGALEIGLPIAVAVAANEKEKIKSQKALSFSPGLLVSLLICLLIAFGLVVTSSRGAWLAVGTVAGIAVLMVAAKDMLRRYALPIGVIIVLGCLIVLFRLGDAFVPMLENTLGTVPAGDTVVSRVELWGQAWGLVQDYYFTGSGLGVFPMVLSTYALLIDVPFLTHVHNLFLQIWLEQGLLGFVAFVWLVVEFYFSTWNWRHSLGWMAWGGIAVVTVVLLHGMVDVLLYSSRGLPLLLMPFGVAVAGSQSTVDGRRAAEGAKRKAWAAVYCLLPAALCLLVLSSFIPHPSSFAAMWYANLGSVEQTQVELGQYHGSNQLVDSVRKGCDWLAVSDTRSANAEATLNCRLQKAVALFDHAVALDETNGTARRRMSMLRGGDLP